MSRAELLRAQLAAAELEDELITEKTRLAAVADAQVEQIKAELAATSDPSEISALVDQLTAVKLGEVDHALKERVREARQAYRAMRDGLPVTDSVAQPDTINAAADTRTAGGT